MKLNTFRKKQNTNRIDNKIQCTYHFLKEQFLKENSNNYPFYYELLFSDLDSLLQRDRQTKLRNKHALQNVDWCVAGCKIVKQILNTKNSVAILSVLFKQLSIL